MDELMTKSKLLELLRSRRGEWDALIAQIPESQMAEPGVAGEWSIKDIMAHLAYHERWYADRLHEQLRGEQYVPNEIDAMSFEQRNPVLFQRFREKPLPEVLTESRRAFEDLLDGVQAHTEAFLVVAQQFDGMPEPMAIWMMLRGDVYDHYPQHIPSVKDWMARALSAS
jgi:uncharacterized damage-inducible protein DinB